MAKRSRASSVTKGNSQARVKKGGGFLSKIGGFVKKALPVAAKLIPGPVGLAAKAASSIFNDPEWWQYRLGGGVSTNVPLSDVNYNVGPGISNTPARKVADFHCAIVEFVGQNTVKVAWNNTVPTVTVGDTLSAVITPSAEMISSYLLPPVRRVVNAVYLQSVESYTYAFQSGANIYAMWRQLLKLKYLSEHAEPYMPNIFDGSIPILMAENKALLDSLITRCEEKLRSSIRLPHTLCEYLAWRYGRVYRTNSSHKAGLVMYNVIELNAPTSVYVQFINKCFDNLVGAGVAQANADLYNAFLDHDYAVVIADDTQMRYDAKEFVLRTNLDLSGDGPSSLNDVSPDIIVMDSDLPCAETFTASTVSTIGQLTESGGALETLMPVKSAAFYVWASNVLVRTGTPLSGFKLASPVQGSGYRFEVSGPTIVGLTTTTGSAGNVPVSSITLAQLDALYTALQLARLCKQMDCYNMEVYFAVNGPATNGTDVYWAGSYFDVTALAIDTGFVQNDIIGNEHRIAFANLTQPDRKRDRKSVV